jgi:hypothetical protein
MSHAATVSAHGVGRSLVNRPAMPGSFQIVSSVALHASACVLLLQLPGRDLLVSGRSFLVSERSVRQFGRRSAVARRHVDQERRSRSRGRSRSRYRRRRGSRTGRGHWRRRRRGDVLRASGGRSRRQPDRHGRRDRSHSCGRSRRRPRRRSSAVGPRGDRGSLDDAPARAWTERNPKRVRGGRQKAGNEGPAGHRDREEECGDHSLFPIHVVTPSRRQPSLDRLSAGRGSRLRSGGSS